MMSQCRTVPSLHEYGLIHTGAYPVFVGNMLPPHQIMGLLYPGRTLLDYDYDLTRVAGHDETARGDISHLIRRGLNPHDQPIIGAQIELWQCDAFGHHNQSRNSGGRD